MMVDQATLASSCPSVAQTLASRGFHGFHDFFGPRDHLQGG